MNKNVRRLKESLASTTENHFEVLAAIENMEELLVEDLLYPGRELVEEAVDKTTDDLEKDSEIAPEWLTKRWKSLSESIAQWEDDHPRLTLAIGDVTRALASAGL